MDVCGKQLNQYCRRMNNMYEVEQCSYSNLPEEVKEEWLLSNNGAGKEYASYIIEKVDGKIVRVESDAMEPEDARFSRNLNWIVGALKEAYLRGSEYGVDKN